MKTLKHLIPSLIVMIFPLAMPANADIPNRAVVLPLMLKELAEMPGKEVLVISVDYPPGSSDPIHRHDAHAFIYVLEGTIEMQLRGEKPVILRKGDVFYEGPGDVHIVGRNGSMMLPAKFLVVLVKNKGEEVFRPAN